MQSLPIKTPPDRQCNAVQQCFECDGTCVFVFVLERCFICLCLLRVSAKLVLCREAAVEQCEALPQAEKQRIPHPQLTHLHFRSPDVSKMLRNSGPGRTISPCATREAGFREKVAWRKPPCLGHPTSRPPFGASSNSRHSNAYSPSYSLKPCNWRSVGRPGQNHEERCEERFACPLKMRRAARRERQGR